MAKDAYSPDGYIVNQDKTADIRYGCRTSDQNGCGWISLCNLQRHLGNEEPIDNAQKDLLRASLFRGRFGTSPFKLRHALKKRGYKIRTTIRMKNAPQAANSASCGILLYRHKTGVHYVAFEKVGVDTFHFWNAIYGKTDHVETMEAFLAAQAVGRVVFLMTVA